MLQTLLTVLLLVAGFVAGLRLRSVRRVAVPLAVLDRPRAECSACREPFGLLPTTQ
jgi:hypothetical protein